MGLMLASMTHRGPDGQGTFLVGGVALGHRRLAIIDLSTGDQPMTGPSGATLVFNGEIYNYRELRRELEAKGSRFKTSSDTEVLLAAYEEWGEACLHRLAGMFAFAIHDPARGRIVLARDRLGKKPLYYNLGREGVAFSSELKGLLALPRVRQGLEIDLQAVSDYLSLGYILGAKSVFSSIRKLLPGYMATFDLKCGDFTLHRWWDASQAFMAPKLPWNMQTVERFEELLRDAVSLRLRSDVPVGVFLSGGLDSSSVTACLGEAGADVRLICARFEQDSFDESTYAREVARHLGFGLTCVDQPHPAAAELSRLVWHLDEPFCDTSIIPTWQISKAARQLATVILGGDGADELLAGYVTHRADRLKKLVDYAPRVVLGLIRELAVALVRPSYKKVSWDYKLLQFLKGAAQPARHAHYFWRTIFDDAEKTSMLSPEFTASLDGYDPYWSFDRAFDALPNASFLDQSLYVDMNTWLPDDILVKCDRMSMGNSLELRSPFLDHRLVEFCARLPGAAKMNWHDQKVVLKRAMTSHLPESIISRPKKGFNFPAYCISSSTVAPPRETGFFREGFRLDPMREDVTYKSFNLHIFSIWYSIYEQFRSTGRWEPLSGT